MTKLKSKGLDYQDFELTKKALNLKGELDVTIVGMSMLPLYPAEGHVAKLRPLKKIEELRRFDVIVFWQNNILISHYFWKKNEHFNDDANDPYLVTRPLNPMKSVDHPIKFEHILGIIPERKIGAWLKFRIYWNLIF